MRRFVASAAENGIDVFRLHDPLNDVSNLREAGEAIVGAGKEFHAGLVYSPGDEGADGRARRAGAGAAASSARRARSIHDPTGGARAAPGGRARRPRRARRPACPSASTARAPAGTGLADSLEAARAGADLIACAVYPLALSLHRVAGESLASALAGMGLDTGIDVDRLWEASDLVDEHIGDEPVTPLAPRLAVRAAEYDLPTGLVAALDTHLRAHAAGDRLLEVLEELQQIRARGRLAAARGADRPDPRLAGADPRPLRAPLRHRRRRVPRARPGRLRHAARRRSTPTVARAVALLSDGRPARGRPADRRGRPRRRPRGSRRARRSSS